MSFGTIVEVGDIYSRRGNLIRVGTCIKCKDVY